MYKIMLVDDDLPFLKYLTQCIDWTSLQLVLCASTVSSVKAMQLFEQHLPDIVLLDIGLPQINGLELAANFQKIKPSLRIIFLTCHEDFHYVKRALQLSADEYLIKDTMNEPQLIEALNKTITQIKENLERPNIYHRDTVMKNIDVLKQSLLHDLTTGKPSDYIKDSFKRLGMEWPYPHFIVGMISLDYFSSSQFYCCDKDLSIIHYGMLNILEDTFANYKYFTGFMSAADHSIYFIINMRKSIQSSFMDDVSSTLKQYRTNMNHFFRVDVYSYLLDHCFAFDQLSAAISELDQAKIGLFYENTRSPILRFPVEKKHFIHSPDLINNYALSNLVGTNVIKKVLHALHESGHIARQNQLDPKLLKKHWLSLFRLTNNSIENYVEQCIQKGSKYDEILSMILHKLDVNKEVKSLPKNTMPKLKEIDQYIMEHLSEYITAVDMANYLYLNPSYFSRFFKKLTAKNFSDYVNEFKVNLAKQMLLEYNEPNSIIAQRLGYSDRTYFSKVFKKYTGYSPSDYKVMHQQKH